MKHSKTLLAIALGAPALFAFTPKAASVKFSPADGSTLTKTFTNTVKFGLDDMSMLMNGEENPMMPQMEMDMTMTHIVTVSDEYVSVKDGRPAKLKRSYDTISQDMEVDMTVEAMGQTNDETATGSGSSELEGKTITFAWDGDADEYKLSFGDDEGDDELLENLIEDMDLRGLLPEDEVSEGDSWDIELSGLVDILAPGGDLKIDIEMDGQEMGGGPDPTMMADMREMLADMLEGEATAKFAETREVDGAEVAVIELSIEIDTARDMSDLIEEMIAEEAPEGVDMNIDRVDVEFALETKGQMLWNIKAGVIHSLELEGEAAVAMDMEMGMDMGGQEMSFEMSMDMSGTMKTTVATE
ncbi:MAG: hypothetical protein GY711_18665 [bacterium]|nr:hypothetical protein [bacterium]